MCIFAICMDKLDDNSVSEDARIEADFKGRTLVRLTSPITPSL